MTIGDELRRVLAARDGEDVLDAARRVVAERNQLSLRVMALGMRERVERDLNHDYMPMVDKMLAQLRSADD